MGRLYFSALFLMNLTALSMFFFMVSSLASITSSHVWPPFRTSPSPLNLDLIFTPTPLLAFLISSEPIMALPTAMTFLSGESTKTSSPFSIPSESSFIPTAMALELFNIDSMAPSSTMAHDFFIHSLIRTAPSILNITLNLDLKMS